MQVITHTTPPRVTFTRAIADSLTQIEQTLTPSEVLDLLDNDESYLCAEFRPMTDELSKVLDTFTDLSELLTVTDAIDDLFIYCLSLKYGVQNG